MPETIDLKTFDADDIADYLENIIDVEDCDLGVMSTCIAIIGKYPFGDSRRDHDLIVAAVSSLMDWTADYRVFLEKVAVEKLDGDQIVLTDS